VMAFWAAIGLAFRIRLAAMTASAIAPTGALFALLSLFTGALWGKPMWGAWWVWDARLTSVLVLFFLYLGHIALLNAFDDPARGGRAAAILALAGIVNLPIIKFSVDWWNTLHQPASISRLARPAIDPAILTPLLVMAAAYLAYFVTLLLVRVRAELAAAKLRAARSALLARG
jgi:heme exporter protein C